MSKGLLIKNMQVEHSPIFDNRDKKVLYLECFGRLMDGISPWLTLPYENTKEGRIRKKLKQLALLSYKNAVDPNSPDMLPYSIFYFFIPLSNCNSIHKIKEIINSGGGKKDIMLCYGIHLQRVNLWLTRLI